MKKYCSIIICILCLLCFSTQSAQAAFRIMEMKPVKDFTLPTLDGEEITLSKLQGKPIIINFFTTWCPSCKEEMPILTKFYEKYKDDVYFLGVNYTSYEIGKREAIGKYVKKYGLNFPVLLDENGEVGKAYEVLTIPTTFFLDKDGVIVKKHIGPLSYEELEQIVIEMSQKTTS